MCWYWKWGTTAIVAIISSETQRRWVLLLGRSSHLAGLFLPPSRQQPARKDGCGGGDAPAWRRACLRGSPINQADAALLSGSLPANCPGCPHACREKQREARYGGQPFWEDYKRDTAQVSAYLTDRWLLASWNGCKPFWEDYKRDGCWAVQVYTERRNVRQRADAAAGGVWQSLLSTLTLPQIAPLCHCYPAYCKSCLPIPCTHPCHPNLCRLCLSATGSTPAR